MVGSGSAVSRNTRTAPHYPFMGIVILLQLNRALIAVLPYRLSHDILDSKNDNAHKRVVAYRNALGRRYRRFEYGVLTTIA